MLPSPRNHSALEEPRDGHFLSMPSGLKLRRLRPDADARRIVPPRCRSAVSNPRTKSLKRTYLKRVVANGQPFTRRGNRFRRVELGGEDARLMSVMNARA